MAEGSPVWQPSQWRDVTACLAVDSNDNPDVNPKSTWVIYGTYFRVLFCVFKAP